MAQNPFGLSHTGNYGPLGAAHVISFALSEHFSKASGLIRWLFSFPAMKGRCVQRSTGPAVQVAQADKPLEADVLMTCEFSDLTGLPALPVDSLPGLVRGYGPYPARHF